MHLSPRNSKEFQGVSLNISDRGNISAIQTQRCVYVERIFYFIVHCLLHIRHIASCLEYVQYGSNMLVVPHYIFQMNTSLCLCLCIEICDYKTIKFNQKFGIFKSFIFERGKIITTKIF
jgi:hypothetical protein